MNLLGLAAVYVLAILRSSSPIQSPAALAAHADHSRMLLRCEDKFYDGIGPCAAGSCRLVISFYYILSLRL